jgi:glycosyltransferase involved in cell wall biosynthesis
MKVLLVHNLYQQPGGEDVVFSLERQMLERAGHQVVVYRRTNCEVHSVSWRPALALKTIWAADARRDFVGILSREKPDVVHVHNTFFMVSPSIYSACRAAKVPVVQTLHNYRLLCPAALFFRAGRVCEECIKCGLQRGAFHGCYRDSRVLTSVVTLMLLMHRMMHTWQRSVECYIAPTEFARQKFIEGGLPAEKIFVKPNFVHPDPLAVAPMSTSQAHASNDAAPSGLSLPQQDGYALFVGRPSPEKGVGTLLAAWERIASGIPLIIVGGRPERGWLGANTVQRSPTAVRFLGLMSHEETLTAIKGARFLVFPSEWYETFGLGIVEAFACGVPVICSRLGAMQEIVVDGRTGFHFTPGNIEDLAARVEWAWAHPTETAAMGRAARAEYEAKYTADRNYRMLIEIYKRAINACKPADDERSKDRFGAY